MTAVPWIASNAKTEPQRKREKRRQGRQVECHVQEGAKTGAHEVSDDAPDLRRGSLVTLADGC